MCVCVCVCVCVNSETKPVYTHTHTHIYIYIYLLMATVIYSQIIISYLPTTPLGQDMTQVQFLSGV